MTECAPISPKKKIIKLMNNELIIPQDSEKLLNKYLICEVLLGSDLCLVKGMHMNILHPFKFFKHYYC